MPEFRQNFITKEWVIIAPERAKRPDQFANKSPKKDAPERDEKCPFCPGNEIQTPHEILVKKSGDKWRMRVVPNKFAAVNPDAEPTRKTEGRFLSAGGFGVAEVVIETPKHNTSLESLTTPEIRDVLSAYAERFSKLSDNDKVDMVTIFRNHGARAGTSLEHPHSQIIATPIVPPQVRYVQQLSLIYHDAYGKCPYCVMIEEEISSGKRVLMETKNFAVLCPYASRVPFETEIIPKRHYSRFNGIGDDELSDLANILRITLKKIHVGLSDPDYNFVIRTSPASDGELHYDHWRLSITPRTTTAAGFEIGSGIFINIMPPERSAEFLKQVVIPADVSGNPMGSLLSQG